MMMRYPFCRIAVCLAAFAMPAGATAQAQDAVTLRYKMAKDDRLIVRKTQTVKQSQSVNDKKFDTEINSTDVTVRTLERVDQEGNFHLRTENKLLKVKINIGPLGNYTYDSTATDNETGSVLGSALTPVYDRLKGALLKLVHTPRGEVVELNGLQDLISDLVKGSPLAAQFTGGGSDKAAALSVAEYFPVMSEKPVRPGDTWEVPYELDLPRLGKAKGKRTYKYVGPDKIAGRETARISVTTDLTFDLDLDMGGTKVKGSLSINNSSGTIQFDPLNGQLVTMKNEYDLAGDLTVTAGDMEIPVRTEQKQTVTLDVLEKLPE